MFEANPLALLPLFCSAVAARVAVISAGRAPGLWAAGLGCAAWNGCVALAACLGPGVPVISLARASLAATMVVAVGILVHLVDTARLPGAARWRTAGTAVAFAGVVLALLDPAVFVGARPVIWGGSYGIAGSRIFVPLALVALLLFAPLIAAARVHAQTPRSRRRRRLGQTLVAVTLGAVASVDVLGVFGYDMFPVGWAVTTLALSLLARSLMFREVIDARSVLLGSRFWVLFVATTFLPLLAVTFLTPGWPGWRNLLGRALALSALALAGAQLGPWLVRIVYRRRDERAARLRAFAAATRAPNAPAEVLAPLVKVLGSPSLSAVAIAVDAGDDSPEDNRLEIIHVDGSTSPEPRPEMSLPPTLATRADLAGEPDAEAALRWLDVLGGDVLVPLHWRRDTVGLLALRAADGGAGLDLEDREFLERLSRHAAVALTNAALHDRLSRRAADLAREVEERTRSLAGANAERRSAQARLVQAEKQSSLGLLVAGVSHEVNNALNFIYGNAPVLAEYADLYGELLTRAGGEPAAVDAATRLRTGAGEVGKAAQLARALVDDLRRFARADESHLRRVDLRDADRAAERILATHLRGRRIEVIRRVADAPAGVYLVDAYPAALHHALLALMLNAAQAVREGGSIHIDLAPAASGHMRLEVRDDGPGVRAEDRERIFEPFFTTRPGAAGLGLSSCRIAITRMGGTVELAAPPEGGGACFVVTLPAAQGSS